jgi:predicted small lipoprotein YifL
MFDDLIKNLAKPQWSRPSLLAFMLTLSACGAVGPYVDPPEPDAMEGPGLFSGAKGEFSMTDNQQDSSVDHMNSATESEFEAWLKWKKLDHSSAEYQRFLQWLEYQQYKKTH